MAIPFDLKFFEDLAQRIQANLPQGIDMAKQDLHNQLRAILQAAFAKLDVVTREEFDVQTAVLARTREKLEQLAAKVQQLEAEIGSRR